MRVLLSIFIDPAQYFLRLGYCEPDDILNNIIGTAIGAIITCIALSNEAGYNLARLKNVAVYQK